MVTEAGTAGERGQPQTSQFSQWPGEGERGEGVGRQASQSSFSQWAGATDDDRRVGSEDTGWAQWAAGSDDSSDSFGQQQPRSREAAASNNQHLEMFDVTW